MKVLVVGSHPMNSPSMRRYTQLLFDAYQALGEDVVVARPTSFFSKRLGKGSLRKWVVYVEQLLLFPFRLAFAVRSADVVHVADHSDSLLLLAVPKLPTTLVTCHDLIAIQSALGQLPEHRARRTGRWYQALVLRGIKRATLLVADSDTTSLDMQKILDSTPIVTVRCPLSPTMFATSVPADNNPDRQKYAIVVSSVGWRKRRELSVETWLAIRSSGQIDDLGLIMVGPELTSVERALVDSAGAAADIQTVRGISDAELGELYARSEFLIQMSRYEGFCWPIIEANYFDRLALCADEPILRETGEGNVFISATLNEDWAAVVQSLRAEAPRAASQRRAAGFTMERFTEGIGEALSLATPVRPGLEESKSGAR